MQVDPINPELKAPGTKRLKLKCDILLSTSAFNFCFQIQLAPLQRGREDLKEDLENLEGERGAAQGG
jgi:hypothetical protein